VPTCHSNRISQNALVLLAGTVVSVVVITCLYWAQSIFIPLAMAVYLAFLLGPLVAFLQRRGVGRVPALLGVMLLTVLLLGGLVWLVTVQATALAGRLPVYNEKIQVKVKPIADRLGQVNRDVSGVFGPSSAEPAEEVELGERPPAVVVKPDSPPWLARLPEMLRPAAHALGGVALAVVLTGFMLLKREDLRNRLIRLGGRTNVTLATRALDETGHRVSRFLIVQALICSGAGAVIGLGLLLLGVEYALLWGFLVFLLRYVPYVGIWFAALPPVLTSLATSDGWAQPLLAVGLIFAVEMIAGNVLEPWLYGRSMGVSEVSLLVSAAFWAFLWGPIGMVLSSPLTVCLAVLGKHYPRLKFLDVLLGDEPALEPDERFYQRLLARDQDEASEIVAARLQEAPAEEVMDELLVRALSYAKRDRDRDDLTDDDERVILEATREIGEELGGRFEASGSISPKPLDLIPDAPRTSLIGCPADGAEDEAALHLLASTLDPRSWDFVVFPADVPRAEVIAIAALQPSGLAHARHLCKRLRGQFPSVKILVARWGAGALSEQSSEQLLQAGADAVTTTLAQTRALLQTWRLEGEPTPAPSPCREPLRIRI
jgi:predicted PurR-regulated permease PerM